MNPSLFGFIEASAPYLVFWSMAFSTITTLRVARRVFLRIDRVPDSAVYTELAGLPLTLLQSVCFVWAAWVGDWTSMLLFLWWGPAFIAIAATVVTAKKRGTPIDWYRWRYLISILCKGYYVAYVAAFVWMQTPTILFAFSVWIINDQYEKAFMSLDADRLRRTFDDFWLFRLMYPAGLLTPYFAATMAYRVPFLFYGTILLIAWLLGIAYVWRKGLLRERPVDPSLLRNMVYFRKLRQ